MSKSVFFNLGHDAGVAIGNWLAVSVQSVAEQLKVNKELTPAQYKTMREQWIKGYMSGMDCTEKRAQNAWATVWQGVEAAHGFKKPKSAEAEKKAAQRAAAKPASSDKSQKAGNVPDAPDAGEKTAKAVKVELSAIEAHILSLWRRGRFGDIVALAQSEAEKAAPM